MPEATATEAEPSESSAPPLEEVSLDMQFTIEEQPLVEQVAPVEESAPAPQEEDEVLSTEPLTTSLPADLPGLFAERMKTIVMLEIFVQSETERARYLATGLVLDDEGTIAISGDALSMQFPPDWLRDIRLYIPDEDNDGYPATYIGANISTDVHYLRADKAVLEKLKPITSFEHAKARVGETLWGLGLGSEDTLFNPRLMASVLSVLGKYHLDYGFTLEPAAVVGAPIFNAKGQWVGLGVPSGGSAYLMMLQNRSHVVKLAKMGETDSFLDAGDFLKNVLPVVDKPEGVTGGWMGITDLQPLSRQVSLYFGLEKQGALVISEVVKNSPADKAELRSKDIITAVNGQPLKKVVPSALLPLWFNIYMADKKPKDTLTLSVLREEQPQVLSITLGKYPLLERNAPRQYLPRLGFTLREMTVHDGIVHRLFDAKIKGVVASFVKPNAPASNAEMKTLDRIMEIDGTEVTDYAQALELLEKIDKDLQKREAVLMIHRGTDTKVLHLQLN